MDSHLIIALFHLAFVVPLFLYVGFQRAATPEWLYWVLFGLGILVLVYHSMKAFARWAAKSPAFWVNAIHVAVVAPLMIWIGYFGKKTMRPAYEMLLIAGFGALGYHAKNLVVEAQTYLRPAKD